MAYLINNIINKNKIPELCCCKIYTKDSTENNLVDKNIEYHICQFENIQNLLAFIKYLLLKYYYTDNNIIIIYKIKDLKYKLNTNYKYLNNLIEKHEKTKSLQLIVLTVCITNEFKNYLYPFNENLCFITETEFIINDINIKEDKDINYYLKNNNNSKNRILF